MMDAKTLFVFDFDDTTVEGSTEYEATKAAPPAMVHRWWYTVNWSEIDDYVGYVDYVMGELHRAGYGREAVLGQVLQMKVFAGVLAVMKKIRSCPHTDMMVLSGANTALINAYLDKIGLRDAFLHVIANLGHFDDSGCLHVKRYHIHQCHRCPGLCKGTVLRGLLAEGNYGCVVFVGDGSNDVCPSTELSERDHIVARELFPLAETLKGADKKGLVIKAHVHTVDFDKSNVLESLLTSLLPATTVVSPAVCATSYSNTKQVLFVFDFDHTLVNHNTDTHIFDIAPELKVRSRLRELRQKIPCWPLMINHVMGEIHSAGHDQEEVTSHMKKVEFFSGMLASLWRIASCNGAEMMVLSDANTVFIDTLLCKVGLGRAFSRIFTNPAYFDSDGRLHVGCYHSHQCKRCQRSPNLCKGMVLKEVLAEGCYRSVVYVGDGEGDVCPSTVLSERDHVVARERFPLAERLKEAAEHGQAIKAHVHIVDFSMSDAVESLLTSFLPAAALP